MATPTRVLIVDDDPSTCQLLEESLGRRGFEVASCLEAESALDVLALDDFHVVVTDVHMHNMSGIELCRLLKENRPDLPVLIMTGFGSQDVAVEALRAGAYDFVTKPFDVPVLQLAIERADRHRELHTEISRLRTEISGQENFEGLIGRSRAMRMLTSLISNAAPTQASVLITGESGTGKELVARAIHARSKHAAGPFIGINCGALPESLLESELFGHVRGAFTDAKEAKDGLLIAADGGTLFLDEIGDLPLGMQVKLLRAIQERRVRPLGATEEVPFNTRIITATHRDIDTDLEEGRFRADLFYRLNVVRVDVAPLRSRGNDVLLLAQHFLERSGKPMLGLSRAAAERMMIYPFPGNVRELENMIEHAVALATSAEIQLEDLPEKIRNYRRNDRVLNIDQTEELISMDELEKRYVGHVLSAVAGNKTQAANVLHVDRKTLYRKLRRWSVPETKDEPQQSSMR
jgi:two-component system, NtrC family, response regulator AtoC